MANTDIDLTCLARQLCKAWKELAVFLGLGIAIGLGIACCLSPKWEVTGVIESMHVGGKPSPIIPNQDVALLFKRLRSTQTLEAVLKKAGYPVDKSHLNRLMSDTSFSAAGNNVELRVKAESYNKAREIAADFLAEIQRQEAEAAAPELQAMRDSLAATEREKAQIIADVQKSTQNREASIGLHAAMILQKDAAIQTLRASLGPPQTMPTQFVVPVSGFTWPIFPDYNLLAILGALAGLAVGLVRVLAKCAISEGHKH